jgi:hypothetical protein
MRKLLLLLFIPFLFSCVDEDTPDSALKETFSVTADSDYFGKYDEAYIILHDLDGKPLEFKQIRDGETIEFQVDKSKRYHVTEYKTDDSSGKDNSFINTILNQDLSEDLILGETTAVVVETAPKPVGEFEVKITNSAPIGSLVSARGYASTYNDYASSVSNTMKSFEGVTRYLTVASTKSGHSRYQFIDNPEADKTYEMNFEDMLEFDQLVKLPVSDYASLFYTVSSINPESAKYSPNYIIKPDGWLFAPEEFYEIGFLGGVENYQTNIFGKKNANSKTGFLYSKRGNAPTSIEIIDVDEIQISKSKITDFEIGTVVPDVSYTSTFSSPLSFLGGPQFQFLQWTIESGSSTKFAIELPEVLKSANNLITKLDELRLTNVSIARELQERSEGNMSYEVTSVSQTYDY